MRTYAIGDIHGQRHLLTLAHARIAADRARIGDDEAPVIHLGDLVDRGPDSAGVIADLIAGVERGEPWLFCLGNHDKLFRSYLDDPDWHDPRLNPDYDWQHRHLGGITTLESYGIDRPGRRPKTEVHSEALAKVPQSHRAFLASLPLYHERGECLYVHAGIYPNLPLELQEEEDLIWIRDPFLTETEPHPWLVVHGHTSLSEATHFGNRVDLDSGAGHGRALTAAVIEGRDVWVLEEDGRRPIKREPV